MNLAKKLRGLKNLQRLCQGAVIFGFVTSAGGNVLHAVEASEGRSTGVVAIFVILAILIPTIFGVMFEIASRAFFRREAHWVMKIIAFVGSAGISGITAWNSYFHQRDAFSHFGDVTQATLLPLAIDGLMIIGSVYLIELGFQVRDMEAWIEGGATRKTKEDVPPTKKDREPSKRERVLQAHARWPQLDATALAAKLDNVSYNYIWTILREQKEAPQAQIEFEPAMA